MSGLRNSEIKNRFRLAVFIGSLDLGGAEKHVCQVLPRLDSNRFQAYVVTITGRGVLADLLVSKGVEVECLIDENVWQSSPRYIKPFLLGVATWRMFRWLRNMRPDICHYFLPAAYILGGIVSIIAQTPVRIMSRRSRNFYQLRHRLAARVERWLHSHMTALVGNSLSVMSDLKEEGGLNNKLFLIRNGVDLCVYSCDDRKRDMRKVVRNQFNTDEGAIVIICVANLFSYKGHSDLLDAFSLVIDEGYSNIKLWLVGRDAGSEAQLKEYVSGRQLSESVIFMGVRQDVNILLSAADIGVLASHEEGFSNAVIEGMASMLPMVVTDVGGNAEAVEDDVCGFVVPPHQPSAIAVALMRLIRDEKKRISMGIAGRKRAMEHFSIEACVSAYESLYIDVWKQHEQSLL